jgi:hypothetical protein
MLPSPTLCYTANMGGLRTFESLSPTDDLVPIGPAGKLIKAVVDNHATHKQVPAFDGGDDLV